MGDRTAGSIAFTAAGLAVASTLLTWPVARFPAAIVALGTALGMGLRRYGKVDVATAGPLGIIGGATLLGIGGYAIVRPAVTTGATTIPPGPAVLAITGILTGVFAYADWLGITRDRLTVKGLAVFRASAIGVSGLFAIVVWVSLITSLVRPALRGSIDPSTNAVLSGIALGLGTVSVVALYLLLGTRDRGFLDISGPTQRDIGYWVIGVTTLIALNIVIGLAFQRLGLASARHSVIRTAESSPEILLVLIPLSIIVIGPGEELLYRNIVQKSLYDAFSKPAAVIIASAIFAGVHLFAFWPANGNPLGTVNTLLVVFILAVILGSVYERTENIVVPAAVHGTFNAVAFAVTYAQLTGAFP